MTAHLNDWQTFVTVAALTAGIAITRFLPFILFSGKNTLPPVIRSLGGGLPQASMAMLLVYCLRNVLPAAPPHGMPEALALAFTAGLHLWRNNVLLSIAGGTVFYMVLVQRVF